jgi:hypothetical protein
VHYRWRAKAVNLRSYGDRSAVDVNARVEIKASELDARIAELLEVSIAEISALDKALRLHCEQMLSANAGRQDAQPNARNLSPQARTLRGPAAHFISRRR